MTLFRCLKNESLTAHVIVNELWEKVGNSMGAFSSAFGKLEG